MKIVRMLYAVPVSDFLPGSYTLCSLTRLLSKIDSARILSGAERRAASGTLLKRIVVRLVESPALSSVATRRGVHQIMFDVAMVLRFYPAIIQYQQRCSSAVFF